MSYTKKKSRKKRQPQQYELPETQEDKAKVQYRDEFQKTYGSRLEEFGSKFEGKGKQIMYALAGLGVLVILLGIFYTYQRRQDNLAQAALGDAIETYNAQVTDTPLPAGVTVKTFKTEKEKAEASIKSFETVATKFGGDYAEKSKYFIAVNRLVLDRAAGINELQALSSRTDAVGYMSKFALAQAMFDDKKFDEAAKLYQELTAIDNPTISKDTINFELAKVYEKQDKKKEAADLYFNIAKAASEAKDSEGNPIPMSQTANDSRAKLKELDPDREKEIKDPEPAAGQMPLG